MVPPDGAVTSGSTLTTAGLGSNENNNPELLKSAPLLLTSIATIEREEGPNRLSGKTTSKSLSLFHVGVMY